MKTKKSFIYFFCFAGMQFFFICILSGQDTISLKNPSFEDVPRAGTPFSPPIKDWHDCGLVAFPIETPPDILPSDKKIWGVELQPHDGKTYLSLVVRFSQSYESVSQKLETQLIAGQCYSFSAYFAKALTYLSGTINSGATLKNFAYPAIIRMWGGNEYCQKEELLFKSTPVFNTDWKLNEVILRPVNNISFIIFEAYFANPEEKPYNGHVMVDNLSPIIEIECK